MFCWPCILCGWLSGLQTRQSSTQSDKYQVSHRCRYFSWWWAYSRPKHLEKRNKRTKKNCAQIWLYLQDWLMSYSDMQPKYNCANYEMGTILRTRCFGGVFSWVYSGIQSVNVFALILYVLCVRCVAFQPTYIDEQNEQKLHQRMLQNQSLTPIYIRSHFLDGAIPQLWPNGEDTATGTEP